MKIIIDAMGGDNAPGALVRGALEAHKVHGVDILLVGRTADILRVVEECGEKTLPTGVEIRDAPEVVEISDPPATAFKKKKNSSLTIGLNQRAFGLDSELHFNSQAAVFGQAAKEMYALLQSQDAADMSNLWVGVGDLYVTVYGGRTRLVGILLGRGLDIDQAKAELNGVTLESLVVAVRVARAMRVRAERGEVDLNDLPLLMHVDDILSHKAPVDIPWERFTFE